MGHVLYATKCTKEPFLEEVAFPFLGDFSYGYIMFKLFTLSNITGTAWRKSFIDLHEDKSKLLLPT